MKAHELGIRCREIEDTDTEAVVDLLTLGFGHERTRAFWQQALTRLSHHDTPPGFPRYGHVLDDNGTLVGVVLQVFTRTPGSESVRCSISSWYVVPRFRIYASLLISRALRPPATYVNATPAPHTWPALEAQGYTRYCDGRVLALLWLARGMELARVRPFVDGAASNDCLAAADVVLLRDHAEYGCLSLVCEASGRFYPFVFMVRRKGSIGLAGLVYCHTDAPVRRFADSLGWYLLWRGVFLVGLNANGPMPGLPGPYLARRPKFFKGPDRPRLDDNAYSERVIFGS